MAGFLTGGTEVSPALSFPTTPRPSTMTERMAFLTSLHTAEDGGTRSARLWCQGRASMSQTWEDLNYLIQEHLKLICSLTLEPLWS